MAFFNYTRDEQAEGYDTDYYSTFSSLPPSPSEPRKLVENTIHPDVKVDSNRSGVLAEVVHKQSLDPYSHLLKEVGGDAADNFSLPPAPTKASDSVKGPHPYLRQAYELLSKREFDSLLPSKGSLPAPNAGSTMRIQCGHCHENNTSKPLYMFLRIGGGGKGFTVAFERTISNTVKAVKTVHSKQGSITTPRATFFKYLDPMLWCPAENAAYGKYKTNIPASGEAWRAFLVKLYSAKWPREASKLAVDPEKRKQLKRRLRRGGEGVSAEDAAEASTHQDSTEDVQRQFLELYPDLLEPIQIWNAYNLDQTQVGLDLANPIVCTRISTAWYDVMEPDYAGPKQSLLQEAMQEKRAGDIEECVQTNAWTRWRMMERRRSKTTGAINVNIPPTVQRQGARQAVAARQKLEGSEMFLEEIQVAADRVRGWMAAKAGFEIRPFVLDTVQR
ncbi:hypothetical protein LTR17_007507 [Elasticomyces elasticus]|nr:hypothetical protein LTR17_007507 [Elasticomyces elasticus]